MKTTIRLQTLGALLGASMAAHAAPVLIPNGDFETPGGADFGFFESAPGVVSFPASGGNGGGYGLVNNTLGSWGGGLVSPPDNAFPANQGIPLANLGLVAGETYTFFMDMKNFAGTGTGGVKLEAWNGGGAAASNTGDMPASGSSSDWATYTWNYTIPVGTTSIKIVPLLTGASGGSTADSVGFDNIGVNNTPVVPPPFVPDQIINPGFEIAGGSGWGTVQGTPTFPTTGGNPTGHTVLNGTGPFTVLYAFNNTEKTFASLGLAPGDTYTFQMDMKLISGSNIGGLRMEGPAGFVIETYPTVIGNGSEWATYQIELTVPATPSQSKFGLRPGAGSVVAFDNVFIVLPSAPAPLQATIAQGTAVSWTPPSPLNAYQPQESPDGVSWTDLGPLIVGDAVSSVFDESTSPFYQVLESVSVLEEAVYNGGFEEEGFDEFEALGWESPNTQLAERSTSDARTGSACMRILAVNGDPLVGLPAESQTSQNTANANTDWGGTGTITVGNTYTLSFWAKQISIGVSYVQEFRVSWLDGSGTEIVIGTWQPFTATIGGGWEEKTLGGLVAPVGATTAFIQITGKLGGVPGVQGEVLIDDVTLISDGFGSPTVLTPAPSVQPAVEISWPSMAGQNYQVQSSGDLGAWSNFGGVIPGDDATKSVFDIISGTKKFYKVGELP